MSLWLLLLATNFLNDPQPNIFMMRFFAVALLLFCIQSCSRNKAKIDDSLQKFFDSANVTGTFSLFNNTSSDITLYNMKLDTQRFLPASTFKIVNTLIGLQTGKITDENMVIKWDSVKNSVDEWNKDLTMKEAFQVSSVPYFQEVARRIGRDTMQQWIDTIGYGNKNLSGPIDSFWLNNSLKISPDEQLGLVNRLYFDKLPFNKRAQQIVRNVMLQEDNTLYKLSYKTGLGYDESGKPIGWVVGWIEENRHVYFFVTFVTSGDKNADLKSARMKVTKDILNHLGFFKGEK